MILVVYVDCTFSILSRFWYISLCSSSYTIIIIGYECCLGSRSSISLYFSKSVVRIIGEEILFLCTNLIATDIPIGIIEDSSWEEYSSISESWTCCDRGVGILWTCLVFPCGTQDSSCLSSIEDDGFWLSIAHEVIGIGWDLN